MRSAELHLGQPFERSDVWVVGDTLHDIHCTGNWGTLRCGCRRGRNGSGIEIAEPDLLVDDLESAAELLTLLDAN